MTKTTRVIFSCLMGMSVVACDDTNINSGNQCPAPPAPFVSAPATTMAGQSSVDVELSRRYLLERVRTMLTSDPTAESGAFIRSIDAKDVIDANGKRRSVLELSLEPWLKGQSGQPASLQRFYKLVLQMTPRLVTPATVPDVNVRRQLLNCDPATNADCDTRESALLSFDLLELYNTSFSRPACSGPDIIDTQIVPQIYRMLDAQAPLTLPTEAIGAVLAGAAGVPISLTDVNLSLDSVLKLGLQYSLGATHAFDTQTTLLGRYSGRDWLVDIDKSIMATAVRNRMQAAITQQAAGSVITAFTASFAPGEIQASGTASLTIPGICGGTTTLQISVRNPTQICKNATGQSIIASWTDSATQTGNFCVNFKTFWDNIGVGTISGPPVVWPTLAEVQFPAGPNDVFYGTDLDMDNAFAIIGRSSVMDALETSRVALPAKCPGVP